MTLAQAALKQDIVERAENLSLRNRIAGLPVGGSVAEAQRVPIKTMGEGDLIDVTEKLRNRMAPAVARAKAHTGHVYTLETGTIVTRSAAIIVNAIVTRIE